VLILDEPTAVLTPSETQALFGMLTALKERGVTILIVTHKLKEVMALTDRVTVMRAGGVVGTLETINTCEAELGEMMVGRRIAPPAHDASKVHHLEPRLTVDALSWRDAQGVARLSDVSFELRSGEIVGVAGVSGNGQSELLELLAGLLAPQQGSFRIACADGSVRTVDARHAGSPKEMRRLGVAHVPEDRHRLGMVLGFPAWESAVLGYQDDPALGFAGLMSHKAMRSHCRELMKSFDVRPCNENLGSSKFSGGNQQKLVLAREFASQPRVLLIGQPTRGVDIGAIELIHQRLREQRDRGCAVLLVSSELDEILALSDRVMVMSGGRVTGMLQRHEADERSLGRLMGQAAPAPIRSAA
jgi:simple sugar transport system ATP-binding protein